MKKATVFLFVCLSVLYSCSGSRDGDLKLLKKSIETTADGTSMTTLFTYDGHKIVSIDGVLQHQDFTYTGDLISKIVTLDKVNQQSSTVEYTYLEGKLVNVNAPGNYIIKYIHNSDQTISYEKFSISQGNQEVKVFHGTLRFLNENFKNDDRILDNVGVGVLSEYSLSFEYDTKKNPFRNILGFDKLLDHNEGISINNNLITMVTSSITINDQITSSANFYKGSFKYDSDNYPTELVSEASISNNGYLKVQYFY